MPALIVYRWLPDRQLCLIVKVDQAEALASSRALGVTTLVISILVLLAALVLAVWLARSITRRVLALQAGAARFGRGERHVPLPETSGDELGQLARAFNAMAASLSKKEAQLQAHASILEGRVQERTEALRALSARQEAILYAVPDVIIEVDTNKAYTWANQAGIEFFGEDVVGHDAAFYFEGAQDTYRAVQPLFDGDENVIYVESWQRRKDGQPRLLAWRYRVLKDDRAEMSTPAPASAWRSAKKIVEQHGGRIWAESGPGHGLTFYFTLPAREEEHGPSQTR